jgi:hypothetical protein
VHREQNECLPGCDRSLPDSERSEPAVECDDQTLARLDETINIVCTFLTENWIATAVLINPMLGLWEAANTIHPAVARPVEEILTMLIHRTTVAPAEVNAVLDELRVLALQASVFIDGSGSVALAG